MSAERITIRDVAENSILATAVAPAEVTFFEGAWYFDAGDVEMDRLTITERVYICPYKGRCYWIDLETADGRARDVGFTYFEVNDGYEFIQHKIAFYAGRRVHTVEEAEQLSAADK